MKYKIIKPIAKIGAIKGSGSEYTGTFPIVVSNANFTIAIDTSTLQKWNGYEGTLTVFDEGMIELNRKVGLNTININDNFDSIGDIKVEQKTQDINITTNANDIATIKSEQTIQDNKITTNSTNISNIVEGLRTSTLVNYKGEWAQGNVAKLGEIWSYQTKLYLCKVATTTNLPTNETDFDLISSFEVNLDNYYTKLEIDNLLANYITTTSINTYLSNYYTKQEIDTKFTNYYTMTEINDQVGTILDTFYSKKEVNDELAKKENTLLYTKGTVTNVDRNSQLVAFDWETQEVVGMFLMRERNDGMWFIEHPSTLTAQLFVSGNGYITLWGQTKEGFTNNYRYTITLRSK